MSIVALSTKTKATHCAPVEIFPSCRLIPPISKMLRFTKTMVPPPIECANRPSDIKLMSMRPMVEPG